MKMSCEIYMVRHGESMGNFQGRFLGHTDLDLTERGYKQAELAASYFKNIDIDKIYSSDLQRAFHTAEAIAKTKNMQVTAKKELREIFAGDWEGMPFLDIPQKTNPEIWDDWANNMNGETRPQNGESVNELFERIHGALEEIAKENDGKKVVVACHGTPIKVMTKWMRDGSLCDIYKTPWAANASVTKFVYENGKFTLEKENDCSHLGNLKTFIPNGV